MSFYEYKRKYGDILSSKKDFLTYKGKPLVRSGDTIYYGDMNDKYVVKMDIKSKKEIDGVQSADRITIQLMLTEFDPTTKKQIVKTGERNGMYNAIDLAYIWLERALSE